MGVMLAARLNDLLSTSEFYCEGYILLALGYTSEERRAERSLHHYWQWVLGLMAGCDLRGCRQTFKTDDNMSPKRMNSQGEKQHTQKPRQEQSDADKDVSFPERRLLCPCFFPTH